MQTSVKNYKISLKIPERELTWLETRLQELEIEYKKFQNFTFLYLPNKLRISVFKRSLKGAPQHVNITGIKSREGITSSLERLAQILVCENNFDYTIDNITAVCQVASGPPLVLEDLSTVLNEQNIRWRLNREIFSGLSIRAHSCTGILYPSGRLVIVGARSVESCEELAAVVKSCVNTITR